MLVYFALRTPEEIHVGSSVVHDDVKFERLDKWKARGWKARGIGDAIRPREVSDATNFSVEWSLDGVSSDLREAAKDAVRVTGNLSVEEPEWAQFYASLIEPFFLHDLMEVCGPHYSDPWNCFVTLNIVAEPLDDDAEPRSVASYTAVAKADPSSVECRQYASCIARGFIGRELSTIPGGLTNPQGTLVTWGLSPWNDNRFQKNREKIDACIAEAEEQLRILREGGIPESNVHMFDYLLKKFEGRLAYCEWLSMELD